MTYSYIGETPHHYYVYIDSTFTHKEPQGWLKATWFGLQSKPGRMWGCSVLLSSGAVLLQRPHKPRMENANDIDGMIANFWRAVQADPDQVAHYADWPVNETDLHARHLWLVGQRDALEPRLREDPDHYDAQIAGWWVWGLSQWIGVGWCPGMRGPSQQLPFLGNPGRGVHRPSMRTSLVGWMRALQERLRGVRVVCGDWKRLVGSESVTTINGLTGVFLDPPYADTAKRSSNIYTHDCLQVAHAVREWCLANDNRSLLRIALCGYEGEHDMPDTWECVEWRTKGGYANIGDGQGKENAKKERIWFSPSCLKPEEAHGKVDIQDSLFPGQSRSA